MTDRSNSYARVDAFDATRVIRELDDIRSRGRRAQAVRDAGTQRAADVRAYEKRRAVVRNATPGSVQAKDDAAVLDEQCDELRAKAEAAKTAENYAKRLADDETSDQSNLQTQARLIEEILKLGGANR